MRSPPRLTLAVVAPLASLGALASLTLAGPAFAQQPAAPPAPPAAEDPRLAKAKEHFLRGVEHTDRNEWDAALAEFLESRAILPTAKNTYNAAVCLRRVSRFDEALDMYEALLREFPNVSAEEKQIAERELAQLRTSIGGLELRGGVPGSKVVIDTRERGTLPLDAPLRVGAGTHSVRVMRDGFLPFEARVEVVGRQTAVVTVELVALAAGGRLHVAEQTGKALDIVLDNAVVGKTPWDGVLPPGDHTVVLRGEGRMGTQPVMASVQLNQTVSLNLLAEQLDANLRVQPKPETARVSVDGVPVGRGPWEGRLRPGTHAVEVTAEGFLTWKRDVVLRRDAPEAVEASLARDPAFAASGAALALELDAALPLGAVFGGDLAASCKGSCSASLPIGVRGVLHGVYQGSSGFGFGIDVGYLLAVRTMTNRSEVLKPLGLAENVGTVDDKLRLGGLTAGLSAQYHRGETWPVLLRFGAGLFFGNMSDTRSGSFKNSKLEAYDVSLQHSAGATYLTFAPEVRIGRRFGEHFELSLGAEVLLMAALRQPKWEDDGKILTTNNRLGQGDGVGSFRNSSLAGSFMMFVTPGLGARYEF